MPARLLPESVTNWALSLPRPTKRVIALAVDTLICVFTVALAWYLRIGQWTLPKGNGWFAYLAAVLFSLPIFIRTGLYRTIFRHSGWSSISPIAKACGVYGLIYMVIFTSFGVPGVPRTVGLIQPMLLFLFITAVRVMVQTSVGVRYREHLAEEQRPRALIYGAGSSGRQLATAIAASRELQIVGFVDDDVTLQGSVLNNLPIFSPTTLGHLVATLEVGDILLAMPGAGRKRQNEIATRLKNLPVNLRMVPDLMDLAQGRISFSSLRNVALDDLLGRSSVAPNTQLLARNITGKCVLVSGAGGSIGSELCRQILNFGPTRLLLLESSEYALYRIHQELERDTPAFSMDQLVPLLADVSDSTRIQSLLNQWRPDTVYHAAAYKHVPLVESNPLEGIRNNVFGTLSLARAAEAASVKDFVLISTDKAVRPTSVMGASKRLAEQVLQALARRGNGMTCFAMVRFGNVLGSSGSVVPLFRRQIREGGPLTLTHPDITRYFMSIPEAAQLVIQAGAMASGGEVFVLDMGEPVRIQDLARRMVELSGLSVRDDANPAGDIDIRYIGLRPGEKLYEELLIGDNPEATAHPRIMKANEGCIPWPELEAALERLHREIQAGDVAAGLTLLKSLVPEFVREDARARA